VRWLRDEAVEIDVRGQKLTLIGVTCLHDPVDDAARMAALVEQVSDDCFQVLLIHAPDIAPEAAQVGVDLYLCGHTHGGQWRIPGYGAVITSSAHGKRFEMGRYPVDNMTLYVSRGIGLEGCAAPRSRLFCPPEIILWAISSP
jgi:predicted MPP superfamily phosphohydrolase